VREQAISASRAADGRAGLDRDEAFDLVEDRGGGELRGREGLLVREVVRPSIPPERLLNSTLDFVQACRERGITPHVAQTRDERRRSAVDGRTVRHAGYEISHRIGKRVEGIFGWTKTVASFRKTRFSGQARTQLAAHLVAAAYDLLRIARLMPA